MGDNAWPRSNAGSERSSVIPDRRDRDRRPRHTPHKKRLAAVSTHENSLKYNRYPRLPFMSGCQLCKDTRRRTYICATDFNKYLAARAQEIAQLRADVEAQQKRLSQASRSQVRMRLEEGVQRDRASVPPSPRHPSLAPARAQNLARAHAAHLERFSEEQDHVRAACVRAERAIAVAKAKRAKLVALNRRRQKALQEASSKVDW